MRCAIKQVKKETVNSVGAPKEIIVESYDWISNGEKGRTYTYRMSNERFERTNKTEYRISIVIEEKEDEIPVASMTYYDFVDFNIEDCIGDRRIEEIAKNISCEAEKVWNLILGYLTPLQKEIRLEFAKTEEAQTSKRNQEIIHSYREKKKKFSMEFGVDQEKYDRCYNVFGELMNAEYLDKIHQEVAMRQRFSENSRKKHKEAWRNFSSSSSFFQGRSNHSEEEKEYLAKFYKVLAKKYHPDANPGIDTSKEMQLINELKKEWGV